MTTFDALETSVESSRPIELYQFAVGTETFSYTSAEDAIDVDGEVFQPIAIARSAIRQDSNSSDRTVTITVPSNNSFATLFVDVVPGSNSTVNIFRYQRDEVPSLGTAVLLFQGNILSVTFSGDGTIAEINTRSIESAMNRNMPRFSYMGMCNHFLFDAACGADPAAFNFTGTVTAESNSVLTVTGLDASGFDFVGGYVRPVGVLDYRMVIAQSGDTITILLPFQETMVGGQVQVFAGCDHLIDGDCALVYDNVANFGGFAFVPNRNPFETGLD